jgi:hypothetical protein
VTAARVAGRFRRFAYPNGDPLNRPAGAGDMDGITRQVTRATRIVAKQAADRRLGYREALARLTNYQPTPLTTCTDGGDKPFPGGPDDDGDSDC